MGTIHDIKIQPEFFNAVDNKTKRAELRKDDRGYEVGDMLKMHEYIDRTPSGIACSGKYTGRVIVAIITHKLEGFGIQQGFCCLSIKKQFTTTIEELEKASAIAMQALSTIIGIAKGAALLTGLVKIEGNDEKNS